LNIKQQILDCVYSTPSGREFAFSSSSAETRERFQDSVSEFLKSKKHDEAVQKCRDLYFSMLDLHDKYPELFPPIDRLNVDELYGTHGYSGKRPHFSHQANVFLLGLYIYHNFELLRKQMDEEMEKTTVEIPRKEDLPFRYSGGDRYGEFLYRWRLASLCHDFGTGIQLCQGEADKIVEALGRFHFQKPIKTIKKLNIFEGRDLFDELDKASGAIQLSQYVRYHEGQPFPDSVHHDHGIMGSLIFLQLMHGAFSRHRENQISLNTEGMKVFWHPEILSHSIIQIALSIAMHNLDIYPQALQKACLGEVKIFDMHRHPLVWLLKIADVLQEWDKPEIGTEGVGQDLSTNLEMSFSGSKILVKNFPDEKKEETKRVIRSFTKPNDVVVL
jgi:hypothetical protein